MPMDKDRLGSAIAATIKSFRPPDGTAVTDATLVSLWQAVANDIITEIKTNADIDLSLGDILVPGASGLTSTAPGTPVGGTGQNDAVVLSEKIK